MIDSAASPTPGATLAATRPADIAAAMDAAATLFLAETKEANTNRAYRAAWTVWQRFCAECGIPDTSNTIGPLVGFVQWLRAQRQAPTTIDSRLAGVAVMLTEAGHAPDPQAKAAARKALKDYHKELTKAAATLGRGKAVAARLVHLHRITAACPDTLAGHRDRALVLVGFRIAARSAEVANLLVSDVEDAERGIVATVRFGKTGGRRVPIPYAAHEDICPVQAWRTWRAAAPYEEGPAFAQIAKNDVLRRDGCGVPLPLGPRGVREVINRATTRAGVEVHLTGHSLRSGFATEARRAGHDRKTISKVTGHVPTSAVLDGYFREVDEWVEAPGDIL